MSASPRHATEQRSTKIVATIGNVSSSPDKLRALSDAGVDIFRLNFSHGTQADHDQPECHVKNSAEKYQPRHPIMHAACPGWMIHCQWSRQFWLNVVRWHGAVTQT